MRTISVEALLEEHDRAAHCLLDVRTPSEYAHAHVPWAHSLPLFDDDERARVGTTYKQSGREQAILLGLDIIGPRMRTLAERAAELTGGPGAGPVVVQCWRGGMRSGSVAWLLDLVGYDVRTLDGGYKAFRRWVLGRLQDLPQLVVLGGRTGSGKTEVLAELAATGVPCLDLEGLANHRGSAFGALEMPAQPSQEQFEANLALGLREAVMVGEPIWVEDESRMIGSCKVPDELMLAIRQGRVLALDVDVELRVARLVQIYGEASREDLAASFERIRKRLGAERTNDALHALASGDLATAARIALDYYDRAYDHGLSLRDESRVTRVAVAPDRPATDLLALVEQP